MKTGRVLPFLFLALGMPLTVGQPAASKVPTSAAEQRSFSAEDASLERPIALPQAILRILARDSEVQERLQSDNLSPEGLPPAWFLASEVHLNGGNEGDVVVLGRAYLRGANTIPFWVFRPGAAGFQRVFHAIAHDIIIKDARSRGYSDIEAVIVFVDRVTTDLYRFDGSTYKRARSRTTKSK